MTIGPNVAVGEGVRIKDAMVLEGADIRQHACILNAIIGARNYIGSWTRIEGSETPTFEQAVNERANDRRIGILGAPAARPLSALFSRAVICPLQATMFPSQTRLLCATALCCRSRSSSATITMRLLCDTEA